MNTVISEEDLWCRFCEIFKMGWSRGFAPSETSSFDQATNVYINVPYSMDHLIIEMTEDVSKIRELYSVYHDPVERANAYDKITKAVIKTDPQWHMFPQCLWEELCEHYPEFVSIRIMYS